MCDDVLTGRNTSQNPSGMIRQKTFRGHFITMLSTFLLDTIKTSAYFYTLNGIDTHKRMRKICIQPVKNRLSETRRNMTRDNRNFCTNGITLFIEGFHVIFHLDNFVCIRTEKRIVVNDAFINLVNFYGSQLRQIADNFYTKFSFK